MADSLDIIVPYQKGDNLCWASVVVALRNFYRKTKRPIEVLEAEVLTLGNEKHESGDSQYELDDALSENGLNNDYYELKIGLEQEDFELLVQTVKEGKASILHCEKQKKKETITHYVLVVSATQGEGKTVSTITVKDPSGADIDHKNVPNVAVTLSAAPKTKCLAKYEDYKIVGFAVVYPV
jgi:hypothetical protein